MTLWRHICSLPNPGIQGAPRELFYPDTPEGHARAEEFAQRENRPGRGVYDCIGKLKDGAHSRSKETVVELDHVIADIDLKNIAEPSDHVLQTLRGLVLPPSEVRDSGFGLHAIWYLNEPANDDSLEQAEDLMKRVAALLAADPAPTHRAALLRRPGTDNTKNGAPRKVCVIDSKAAAYDITELGDMIDLYDGRPLLTRKQKAKANGRDPESEGGTYEPAESEDSSTHEPVDVGARLAAMQFEGPGDTSIHNTQLAVTASMLRAGVTLDCVVDDVTAATRRAVANDPRAAAWDWKAERWCIERMAYDFVNKHPELIDLLPDPLLQSWRKREAAGDTHIKVVWWAFRNRWCVKSRRSKTDEDVAGATGDDTGPCPRSDGGPKAKAATTKKTIRAIPFAAFDEASLPPREFLFGKHYQRGQCTATIGPGGAGKTSYSQVEAVAMATIRNLLGEQPEERLRVWLHNGDDDRIECNRRIAAICRHYNVPMSELEGFLFITSKSDFQIKLASGNGTLVVDHASITQIVDTITENQIDAAIFDPLITLHAVAENDNPKMNAVIHLFGQIAEDCNCGIELCHHTRKLLSGGEGYGVDDGRGASAIRDALRATRVINAMTVDEARNAGIPEEERLFYLRVNRGKANYLPPAVKAAWFKFENITLLNGDNVGVLGPWQYPGQESPAAEITETQRIAEQVFMQLLARLTLEGREASDRKNSSSYAPTVFAEEREAKIANVGKKVLEIAMRRLFETKRIRAVVEGRHQRHQIVINQTTGA
jgi:RecA-family ATPase